MALILKLDKRQYLSGVVNLNRGDDWAVTGNIVDRVGNVDSPVDISAWGTITGFLPGVVATVTKPDASCGQILLSAASADTAAATLEENGVQSYVTAVVGTTLQTIETADAPIVIKDRGNNW